MFDIHCLKVVFHLTILHNTEAIQDKTSAIRGTLGRILLDKYCRSDENCKVCALQNHCVVYNIFYMNFKKLPRSANEGNSIGYIFYCENTQTLLEKGQSIFLEVTLFGGVIDYFSQLQEAVLEMGSRGFGKEKVRFRIEGRYTLAGKSLGLPSQHESVTDKTFLLRDYIRILQNSMGERMILEFVSPCIIKRKGLLLTEPDGMTLLEALERRLYFLNCFEGNPVEEPPTEFFRPHVRDHYLRKSRNVERYSFRKKESMKFQGIIGHILLDDVSERAGQYLLAGQITHIGKSTSFGFGKYRLEKQMDYGEECE